MPKPVIFAVFLALVGVLSAACGGGNGEKTTPPPAATATAGGTATATASPEPEASATARRITPPLEGPARGPGATKRTNYRKLSEFRLPAPEDLPEPPDSATGPEFHPPAEPQCPKDWKKLERPAEGFRVCYPEGWSIEGHGYVSVGVEDRWYSLGLFLFQGDAELAHVSIYVINPYARPFTYTRDCDQAYRVTFAGEAAVLCADHPGQSPEAKIIAYHVRMGDLDYFINVVPRFQREADSGTYLKTWSKDAEATGIEIAQTVQLMEPVTP